ncbi:MAG: hypothetical protein ABH840_00345 [Nanoarchaeota archaeon]
MAGETLVEKCRVIDQTKETDKVNPTDEQISRYRLVLEEWRKTNYVVKDVFEGKTSFESEIRKILDQKYDDKRSEMIFQCIPRLKKVYDNNNNARYLGYGAGAIIAAPIMIKEVFLTRRNFLTSLLIGGGAIIAGGVSGAIVSVVVQSNVIPDALNCNLDAKYLDNVVDSVRKK